MYIVSWKEINDWPIKEAGLPLRIVNLASKLGINNIGSLQQATQNKKIKGLGIESQKKLTFFWKLCETIINGKQPFNDIDSCINFLLSKSQMEIIAYRYVLHENIIGGRIKTLEETAKIKNISRERTRQIEKSATKILRSKIATLCLMPFYAHFVKYIEVNDRAVSPEELNNFPDKHLLGGLNIFGLLVLFSNCTNHFTFYKNRFFTTIPASTLENIEEAIVRLLEDTQIMSLSQIIIKIFSNESSNLLTCNNITEKIIKFCVTDNLMFFKLANGQLALLKNRESILQKIIIEIASSMPNPIHYKSLHREINNVLEAGCRVGSGTILRLLNTMVEFKKQNTGLYSLQ